MRVLALLLLLLLPGAALAQTAEEERDRGVLQAFIEDNLSDAGRDVRIEGFAGALSSRATLDRLTIADSTGVWLELEGASLDWTRSALLRGRLDVSELSAEKLILHRLPIVEETGGLAAAPSPEAPGFVFALPELPVSIDVKEFRIDRAEFGAPVLGQEAALKLVGSASLDGGEGSVDIAVDRLDDIVGRILVTGDYSNASTELNLALTFQEGPGGIAAGLLDLPGEPAVDLTLDGDGTLDDFTADLRLATDGDERVIGTITLGALPAEDGAQPDRRFAVDIDGDIAPLLQEDYREFVGDSVMLDVAGVLRADGRLELERMDVATGAVALQGALELGPDNWPRRIAVTGQIAAPGGGDVLLAIPGPQRWVRRIDLAIDYDSGNGDAWLAEVAVEGYRESDLSIGRAALLGSGTLERGDGDAVGRVEGLVELEIDAISLLDEALQQAVGTAFAGSLSFDYIEAQPLDLTDIALVSGDLRLTGDATISGVTVGESPAVDGALTLMAADLSRFAPITGMGLEGGGDLTVAGRLEPLGGAFDLTLTGTTDDIAIGNPILDPLITGGGIIDTAVRRSTVGLVIDRLSFETPATDLTAAGALATGAADLSFSVQVEDASVVDPALAGPASLGGTAVQEGETWTLAMQATGPGSAAALIDGTVVAGPTGLGEVSGIVDLTVGSLAPYSGLVGRNLGGALALTLAGMGDLADGSMEATVTGEATDLALGIDPVDTLLAGTARLSVDAARDPAGLVTVRQGVFETPQGSATVAGTLGVDGARLDFGLTVNDVAPFAPGLSGPATAQGLVAREGGAWQLNTDISAPGGVSAGLQGTVTLTADGPGPVNVSASLEAEQLAPYSALAGRDLAGAADLEVTASGDLRDLTGRLSLSGTTRDLAVDVPQVDPLLAGETALALTVARDGDGTITIDRTRIDNAQITADVAGSLSADLASVRLNFDADLAEAALVLDTLAGPVSAAGTFTRDAQVYGLDGTLGGPGDLAGTVDGTVTLADGALESLAGTVELSVARLGAYAALTGRDLAGAATLRATGDIDLRDLTGSLDLNATGTDLALGIDGTGAVLAGDSRLRLTGTRDADGRIVIETGRFDSDAASLTAAGSLDLAGGTPGAIDARLRLDSPDLSVFSTLAGRDLAGSLILAATADGNLDTLTGALTVDASGTDLALGLEGASEVLAGPVELQLALTRDAAGRITIERGRFASAAATLTADGGLTVQDGVPGAVEAAVTLEAPDLSVFSILAGRDLAGALRLSAEADGNLDTLTGSLALNARGSDLALGIDGTAPLLTGTSNLDVALTRDAAGRITIREGRFASAAATLTADGGLTLRDGRPGAVDATVTLNAPDLAVFSALAGRELGGTLALSATADGDLDALTGRLALNATGTDLMLGVEGAGGLLKGDTTLDLALAREADGPVVVERGRFRSPVAEADLAGSLTLDGTEPVAVNGQAMLDVARLDALAGLVGRELDGALAMNLTVDADLRDLTGRLALNAEGEDLALGIGGTEELLAGEIVLDLAVAREPGGPVEIERGRFQSAAATVEADGTLTLQDGTPALVDGAVSAEVPRLEVFSDLAGRALSGAMSLKAEVDGDLRDLTGRMALRASGRNLAFGGIDQARDLLAGETVLDLAMARAPGGPVVIERGVFDSAAAQADLAGDVLLENGVPAMLDATAKVNIDRLGAFSALTGRALSGSVAADLDIDADLRDFTGSVDIDATALDLRTGIDIADRALAGRSTLALTASREESGAVTVQTGRFESAAATADIAGSLARDGAQLSFDLAVPDTAIFVPELAGAASLTGVVGQDGDDWRVQAGLSGPGGLAGTVDATTTVTEDGPGPVTASVDLEAESLSPYSRLSGQRLSGGLALTATAEGSLSDLTGTLEADVTTRNLGIGNPAADKLLAGTGTLALTARRVADGTIVLRRLEARTPQIAADLTGRYGASGTAGTFDVRLANLGLFAPGFSGPATARGTAREEGDRVRIDAAVTGPGGVSAQVAGTVDPSLAGGALGINGSAPLALANTFIAPNLITGTATFDLSLNGPLELASLSGTVRTGDAALTLPALKLRLTGLTAEAQLGGGRAQVTASAAVSTGGAIRVSGPVNLSPPFVADLTADVQGVRVLDPGLYETVLNGRVTVDGALAGGAAIAGTLNLGTVELRIPDAGGPTAVNLPGLVHENQPNRVLLTRIRAGLAPKPGSNGGNGSVGVAFPLNLQVNAPNRIFVRGRGLDAELGGSLRLTGTTADVVTEGSFDLIRGRLDILGERLTLTQGNVRLQGDFDPYIRLVATAVVEGVSIRIAIEGFASQPELTITSVPDLPEEEVLALLIFKRGLTEISPLQAIQLGLAIRTLAGGGGEGVLGRLRENFGLDDLDVTTDAEGNAQVRAGAYINDNLYTDVTVDSEGKTEVNLNLEITPSVTARGTATSEGETSIGIFYERDY